MIKNYVVRIRNVKAERLNTFLNYLNNTEHKNHAKHNTNITEYSDRKSFYETTSEKLWKNAEAFTKRARGGRRLKVVGKSLTFNIPPKFEFNDTIAADLSEQIKNGIKILYNTIGYELKEEEIYSVLHDQDNSHFHVIIPYLDMEGKPLRGIKPKKFLNELKLLWNEIMINAYGMDLNQYQPLEQEEQILTKNKRYLNELKEYYLSEFDIEENYIKNQVLRIDRLLKLDNDELDKKNKTIEKLEKNLEKAINNKKVNEPKITRN